MTKQIKLMSDYHCYPLWWAGSAPVGNINPETLPLSPELISRLENWAKTFDSWMNFNEPNSAEAPAEREVQLFEEEGIRLWKELRRQLLPDYEVFYHSHRANKILFHPDDL